MKKLILAVILLSACGRTQITPQECLLNPDTPKPAELWEASFTERSGSCGPLSSELISLRDPLIIKGCEVSFKYFHSNTCSSEAQMLCYNPALGVSVVITTIKITQHTTNYMEATYNVNIIDDYGWTLCNSTYSVSIERM